MNCSICNSDFPRERLFCPGCGASSPELELGEPLEGVEGVPSPHAPLFRAGPERAGRAPATSPTAVFSLLFGILAYLALPIVGAVIAVVTGHHARREIRDSHGRLEGTALATTGLALGYSQFALIGAAVVMVLALAAITTGSR